MSRKPTGSLEQSGGSHVARITVVGKRLRFELTTCRLIDKAKAEERCRLLAVLARDLTRSGHGALAPSFLERAGACDGPALDGVVEAVRRLCDGEASGPFLSHETFRDFGVRWTSGALHRRWPHRVKKKKNPDDDRERLQTYVYPVIGSVPLKDVTVAHADAVLSAVPTELAPATQRHVAQCINRVQTLAAYPARIIARNPLPRGSLPSVGKRKAASFLHPDEDAKLVACVSIPLAHRLFYGFKAREGMRRSEVASLTWNDLDLERGAVTLDDNKTDDPRAWALDPGVTRALRAYQDLVGAEDAAGAVFADLRATFVTLALANGRTETWVADRTGHRSSVMINRYRRAARRVGGLDLGALKPLDEAIPELRPEPGRGQGP